VIILKKIIYVVLLCIFVLGCKNTEPLEPNETAAVSPAPTSTPGEVIATFQTTINDKQPSRVHNVDLATSALNDKVIEPGGEISFNELVGARTSDRGYEEAYIFVGNEKEKGIGGGICQVSTTLYNACLGANFEILERHEHSREVTYIELGRDATVSSSLDMRAKNTLGYDIKINTYSEGGSVRIDIVRA
jgi:vancomycin resistance protein YoaR